MIIGIDASRALRPHLTGTERYSLAIIRHLLALPAAADHHWRLYIDTLASPHLFPTAANIELVRLPQRRLWTHRALASEVLQRPPDVLFIPSHVLPFVLPARRLPPSVVTIHDLGYYRFPEAYSFSQRQYLIWSTRWSAAAATRLIAVSQATATDLIEHCQSAPDKIAVVHEAAFEPQMTQMSTDEEEKVLGKYGLSRPYALYLGTLQPRKNLLRLIQAYKVLVDLQPGMLSWDLVLAGNPSWHSQSLYELVDSYKLRSHIKFLGYVPDQEAATLLANAHFFAFPSLFEGFGLPVLEAQQAGIPVMTANNSSLPEVAGDAALLVDPTDIDEIANAMLRLSQDEGLRQKLITAGYENVKRFSWQKAARETLDVLLKAAKMRG